MLEIRHISVFYGDVQAVKDVSLQVEEGTIAVLLGPNAAGKSTTLRAISGVLKVRTGEILLDQTPIHNRPAYEMVERGVIHVPEGRGLFGSLTVRENLALGAYTTKARREAPTNLEKVFTLFPRLKERERQLGGTLSGGEQQMLAIGRALMSEPRMLLLDEPSLGLAPILVAQVFETIKEINSQGTTVLLVEQNALQALSIAHRGYVLQTGEVVLSGSADSLRQNETVRKAYLGED